MMARQAAVKEIEFARHEFFERKMVRKCLVLTAMMPMTQDQARQAYLYRPCSEHGESRWGGNGLENDDRILKLRTGERCVMCEAPTRMEYLKLGICPDCDGRAEAYFNFNPHEEI